MLVWLLVLLGVVLFPWVAGPVLVRLKKRQQVAPTFEAIEPATAEAPDDVWPFFSATMRALHAEGFLTTGYLARRGLASNVDTWLLLLERRASQEIGIAVAMYATVKAQASQRTHYVEFAASWEDRSAVTVGNSSVLSVFPKAPGILTVHLPELSDPRRVLAVHRALVARHGSPVPRRYPAAGEFQHFLELSMERELARHAAEGYLEPQPDGLYRPTWKGSVLMTWRLLWPVSAIRRALRHRRNLRLIAELGV